MAEAAVDSEAEVSAGVRAVVAVDLEEAVADSGADGEAAVGAEAPVVASEAEDREVRRPQRLKPSLPNLHLLPPIPLRPRRFPPVRKTQPMPWTLSLPMEPAHRLS